MTTQPEALRLAGALLEPVVLDKHSMQADDELRRLHAECEALSSRRDRLDADLDDCRDKRDALHAECEALRFTRVLAQARYENAVKLLTGIHELLYPAPVNTPDGRTLLFRPDDTDPHAVLQLLSDRIRAIPAELEAARAAKEQSNG